MGISYVEPKTVRAALQWTGTNEAEFEEFFARLGMTATVTSSSGTISASWSAGSWWSAGSFSALPTTYWVLEEPGSSTRISWTVEDSFDRNFRQVYP